MLCFHESLLNLWIKSLVVLGPPGYPLVLGVHLRAERVVEFYFQEHLPSQSSLGGNFGSLDVTVSHYPLLFLLGQVIHRAPW